MYIINFDKLFVFHLDVEKSIAQEAPSIDYFCENVCLYIGFWRHSIISE